MIRRRILVGATLGVLFAAGWWVGRGRASTDLYANTDLFLEILHAVQTSYVDPVDVKPLIEGGLHGMVKDLDPYSQYLDAHEYQQLTASLEGDVDGVGVIADIREGYPVVVAAVEGSPAWKAGLGPGDLILKADDHSLFGMNVPDAGEKLRGAPGTEVTLTVLPLGAHEPREVKLTRARMHVPAVSDAFVTPQHTAYIRLANFTNTAAHEVRAAVDSLRARGAKSLVLDLRGDPGGLTDQAIDIAEEFVPEGSLILTTKGRATGSTRRYVAPKGHADLDWPMAVLIDAGSASASEIVAGALQDLDRAVIVGGTSFGKGSVQDIVPLRQRGGAVKLTTAYDYTPSGRSIHRALPKASESDDDSGDDSPADSASADSAAAKAPLFRSRTGRVIRGGGGITPDVAVAADSTLAHERLPIGSAAARAALERDPVFIRARDIVTHARAPREVFAVAVPAAAQPRVHH